jgi:hypothetical protein
MDAESTGFEHSQQIVIMGARLVIALCDALRGNQILLVKSLKLMFV